MLKEHYTPHDIACFVSFSCAVFMRLEANPSSKDTRKRFADVNADCNTESSVDSMIQRIACNKYDFKSLALNDDFYSRSNETKMHLHIH